jgi:glycosyltransferase involved in cell wall biosynthesis
VNQDQPLVSVITPTWNRHDALLNRCVPSVQAQTWPQAEHLIISDGPDPVLADRSWPPGVRYLELPEHPDVRWGHLARQAGIAASRGQIIAYLDDDDAYRPEHLETTVRVLLTDPVAGFAIPRMLAHTRFGDVRIGDGALARGRVATSMIVHWRDIFDVATWEDVPAAPDWDLVSRWLDAGIRYASPDVVSVDYYPDGGLNGVPVSYAPHVTLTP